MEQQTINALDILLNQGVTGAFLVLLLFYVIYSERQRKKNIEIIVNQIINNNSDSVEELKALETNYREHLKKTIEHCYNRVNELQEIIDDKTER